MPKPMMYDTHTHTPLCKHAVGEPEEYARAALQRGLKGLLVTCHNPMPNQWGQSVRMAPEEFGAYLALVERARRAMEGQVEVRLGLECDYMPGLEDWIEKQIASAPLEYVLGSVHPHMSAYKAAFPLRDALEFQKIYFENLARAAETKFFDTLSHPDLVKNVTPNEWQLERILDDVRRCLDRVARAGMALELNTSGLQKSVPEMNPGPEILREIRARGMPVVVGSDAHAPRRVGADFEAAFEALEAAGFEQVSFFLQRRRVDVPLDAARASLAARPVSAQEPAGC